MHLQFFESRVSFKGGAFLLSLSISLSIISTSPTQSLIQSLIQSLFQIRQHRHRHKTHLREEAPCVPFLVGAVPFDWREEVSTSNQFECEHNRRGRAHYFEERDNVRVGRERA